MIRTIIVDDEPLALRQVKSYVERNERLQLIGEFRNAEGARKFIDYFDEEVELILCDINMPGESGVEFINSLHATTALPPMVIFTTAHAEFALDGFRLDAVDYLMKPLAYADFAHSVERAYSLYTLRSGAKGQNEEGIDPSDDGVETVAAAEEIEPSDEGQITIKSEYRQVPIRLSEIVYLESEGEYIRLHLANGRSLTTLYRLKNMEVELPSSHFVRIHRSYIVNIGAISSYERGRAFISDIDYLPIGLNYREAFREAMDRATRRTQTRAL
ncbi:MAG: LytTR family DNA-binding domain-containing protein [Rikenellaceae bacterium]